MLGILRFGVRIYQVTLSPLLQLLSGPAGGCRFHPTCSEYFLQAIEAHGAAHGSWLGIKRISRCHPWGGRGHDPIPPRISRTSGLMARTGCE